MYTVPRHGVFHVRFRPSCDQSRWPTPTVVESTVHGTRKSYAWCPNQPERQRLPLMVHQPLHRAGRGRYKSSNTIRVLVKTSNASFSPTGRSWATWFATYLTSYASRSDSGERSFARAAQAKISESVSSSAGSGRRQSRRLARSLRTTTPRASLIPFDAARPVLLDRPRKARRHRTRRSRVLQASPAGGCTVRDGRAGPSDRSGHSAR